MKNKEQHLPNATPQSAQKDEQLAKLLKEFELIELEERFEMVQVAAAATTRCTNEGCTINHGCEVEA